MGWEDELPVFSSRQHVTCEELSVSDNVHQAIDYEEQQFSEDTPLEDNIEYIREYIPKKQAVISEKEYIPERAAAVPERVGYAHERVVTAPEREYVHERIAAAPEREYVHEIASAAPEKEHVYENTAAVPEREYERCLERESEPVSAPVPAATRCYNCSADSAEVLNNQNAASSDIGGAVHKAPAFGVPSEVQSGQWLSRGFNFEYFPMAELPKKANIALKIYGDSMAPMYLDSDVVFIKCNVLVESGQIGLFFLNGKGYISLLQGDNLLPLNMNHPPVPVDESDDFFCAGRVIGKAHMR